MSQLIASEVFESFEISTQIQSALEEICRTLKTKLSIETAPYSKFSLNSFAQLPEAKQKDIFALVAGLRELLQVTEISHPTTDLIQAAAKYANLNIDPSFWTTIRGGDIIEIYNNENIPLAHNLEFFKYSSYDILMLLTQNLKDLFERDATIEQAILQQASMVSETQPWQVEPHELFEKLERHRNQFLIYPGFVAPVRNSEGQKIGWISSIRVKPLGSSNFASNLVPI